nr:cation:proton antiporter [Parvularcula dongshanensis]
MSAGTILALSLVSDWVKARFWVSEALVCLTVGVLVGPAVLGLFEFDVMTSEAHRSLFEQTARLTVSLSVMGAALRLPAGWLTAHWRSLAIVLTLGMAAMWAASALLVAPLGLGLLGCLLVGAIVTPTDPVLAASIVEGKVAKARVRERTRHAITAESGINDGLALPFVLLPTLLLSPPGDGPLWAHYLFEVILWQVVAAAGLGGVLGWVTGRTFVWMAERGATDAKTVTAVTLALTIATLAGVRLMGADGILGVFTAGILLNGFFRGERDEHSQHFQTTVDRVLTLPVFILLGVALPFSQWGELGWPLVLTCVLVTLFRRFPAFASFGARLPLYGSRRTASFAGWFGPIGVAAIFYATLALHRTELEVVWPIVTALVTTSVITYGVCATPLTRRFGDAK